jgi:hypothetical protein
MTLDIATSTFLEICSRLNWHAERIPVTPDAETADYNVSTAANEFIVELKQLNPNRVEREKEAQVGPGKIVVHSHEPGDRLRPLIRKANRQIKGLRRPGVPGLLVVYDTRLVAPVEPYDVLTAMYGLQTVVLEVDRTNPHHPPRHRGERFGGKRSVAPTYNRSVSAVAIIPRQPRPAQTLLVFHNVFAMHPLERDMFRKEHVFQFQLSVSGTGEFSEWETL